MCKICKQLALLYSYTFTQLNRDCHWLILGHMAWTNWSNVSRTWYTRLGKHQDSKENKTNWFPEGSDIKCVMYWPTIWPVYHMSQPNPRYTCAECHRIVNRELKQRRFWATHVNRKWVLFPSNMPWRYWICTVISLCSQRDGLPENLANTTTQECTKSTPGWRVLLKNVFA